MNFLIVAHPDDEIIWFNPKDFDYIVIVFSGRENKPLFHKQRSEALSEHPYFSKIINLGLKEPGNWESFETNFLDKKYFKILCDSLEKLNIYEYDSITTHALHGEYGHYDHIAVHYAVIEIYGKKNTIYISNGYNIGQDEILFSNYISDYVKIKRIYQNHGVWTWNKYRLPQGVPSTKLIIDNRNLRIASLASIPEREYNLQIAINSIYPQLDELNVYLNGYEKIPQFLNRDKIKVYMSHRFGDFGDASKFFPLKNKSGYLFTLDDDLIYPPNYVEKLVLKIEKYKRQQFICVHGNIIDIDSLSSYYKYKKGVHFSRPLDNDITVNIPGTGTLAYHSSLYSFSMESFQLKNMSDIWVAVIAKKRNIAIISIDRPDCWIRTSISKTDPNSIYSNREYLDKKICEVIEREELYKI
ncbi:hypothetical protein [Photorhabdus stackebrandtii]|uniref:Uncharacterized protein n=1 Tax=Photorhabdus stackebrandtii TaxID=1123042 RepID=A0A7X5TKQ1_9GAMM|nr:hypothetical protein [Photorhabdus stackebrandtii]NHB95883.1 hypothetical protein [Photorhabdus stackebrandtii]